MLAPTCRLRCKENCISIAQDMLREPKIEFDRAHRALRPRGLSASPRDVICRVHYYMIKEQILLKARTCNDLQWRGSPIQLFPDLSWHTLQQRRCLQPLLTLLRDNRITYRWGYPFSLTAKRDGISSTLRVPEDLPNFCSTLRLTCPHLPGWEPLPTMPPTLSEWTTVTPGRRSSRRNLQQTTPLRGPGFTPRSSTEKIRPSRAH